MFKGEAVGLQDAKGLPLRQGEKTLGDMAAQQRAGGLWVGREQIRQIGRHLHQLILGSPMLETKEEAGYGIKRARKHRHLPLMQLLNNVGLTGEPAHATGLRGRQSRHAGP